MSTPNVALLKQTLAHVEAHQADWNQRQWITPADEREDPSCGTAYCFAGWAVALSGYKVERTGSVGIGQLPPEVVYRLDAEDNIYQSGYVGGLAAGCGHVAAVLLGIKALGSQDGEHLFDGYNTLDDLRRIVAELCGESAEAVTS